MAELGNRAERTLFLRTRFGFTKLALNSGASIVPVYTFNQDKCFDFAISTNKFLVGLGRKVGFLPLLFFGFAGIPLGPPKPVALTVVIGKPIKIPKIEKPTKEDIAKYHELFVASVEKLYNDNRAAYGLSNIALRIK